MKERSGPSHGVAQASNDSKHRLQRTHSANNDTANDDDIDDDWDFGVGKLVIDLEADAERNKLGTTSPHKPNNLPSNMSSPARSPGSGGGAGKSGTAGGGGQVEHQASVDKGLKVKIKRKGGKNEGKHEIIKEAKLQNIAASATAGASNEWGTTKTVTPSGEKERNSKGRGSSKKDRGTKQKVAVETAQNGAGAPGFGASIANSTGSNTTEGFVNTSSSNPAYATPKKFSINLERVSVPVSSNAASGPNSPATSDPYEFNAKVEDKIVGLPMKKMKLEKESPTSTQSHAMRSPTAPPAPGPQPPPTTLASVSMAPPSSPQVTRDVSTETSSVGTITDPDCLGPCEPGTSVTLEGLVWHETENGVLVLNVSWRGRTYVGTLLDATKHDWAPPRLNCDSPTSDLDSRTPKGRGKRKAAMNTPGSENYYQDRRLRGGKNRRTASAAAATFVPPPSPAKADTSAAGKRRARASEGESTEIETRAAKRGRMASNSRSTPTRADSPTLIECPEPNCNKKYRHVNGLRYHQSHAHHHGPGLNSDEGEKDGGRYDDAPENSKEANKVKSSKNREATSPKASKIKKEPISPTEEGVKPAVESMDVDVANASENSDKESIKQEFPAMYDSVSVALSVEKENRTIASKTVDMKAKVMAPPMEHMMPVSGVKMDKNGNSQVYQFSGSSLSCVGSVTVVSSQSTSTPLQVVHSTAANPLPIAATITAVPVTVPTAAILMEDKAKKGKGEKSDNKMKVKSTLARPIMPVPQSTPQIHPHGTVVTASTTSQLKPIQPKPTILGEPASVNPALVSFNKEKKHKKKKSKDKERSPDINLPGSQGGLMPKDNGAPVISTPDSRGEGVSVIKGAAISAGVVGPNGELPTSGAHVPKPSVEAKTSDSGSKLLPPEMAKLTSPGKDKDVKLPRPPSNLSLNSPVENGDANSPAYSDISDANEAAPTLEVELEGKKTEEEPKASPKASSEQNSTSNVPPGYNMYPGVHTGYFNHSQPPYLVPAVPSQNSPGGQQPRPSTDTPSEEPSKAKVDDKSSDKKDSAIPPPPNPGASKDSSVKSSPGGHSPDGKVPPGGEREYQKALQAQYFQYQQQLVTAYGYPPDQAYHYQLLANDPNYRYQFEKQMAERERQAIEEKKAASGQSEAAASGQVSPSSSSSGQPPSVIQPPHMQPAAAGSTPGTVDKPVDGKAPSTSKMSPTGNLNKPPALIHDRERLEAHKVRESMDKAEQALREKQNENHQILKENIELKQQMEKENRQRTGESYDPKKLYDRQREECERYLLYEQRKHEQQQADHRKLLDHHRGGAPEHISRPASREHDKGSREQLKASPAPSPRERSQSRESSDARRLGLDREMRERDMRSPQDRLRNESPHPKSSSPRSTPKPKTASPHPNPQHLGPPHHGVPHHGGPHPGGLPNAYTQYYPHAQYLQNGPYGGGQVPLDPNHPLYRAAVAAGNPAVLGYPGYMMASPGGTPVPISVADHMHGKAAELQQRAAAAQYYNSAAFMHQQAAAAASMRHHFGPPK